VNELVLSLCELLVAPDHNVTRALALSGQEDLIVSVFGKTYIAIANGDDNRLFRFLGRRFALR